MSSRRTRERGATDHTRTGTASARRPLAVAGLAGGLSLVVYLWTLAPTVLADDSAELVASIHVLGVPHPTGYPIYVLLGKLFDLLPFATPPIRVGLLSALCGAGAVACVAWAAARLSASAGAGVLAGLVTALSGPMWAQATQPEVYALSALIIALAVAVFVRWDAAGGERHVLWLALLMGLGLAHHRAAIFFTAPLFLVAAVGQRAGWRLLLKCAGATALPLVSYLYVPLRAAARPPVMWAGLHDSGDFVRYMLGTTYRHYVFARPLEETVAVAGELVRSLSAELTLGGLALPLIGLVSSLRGHRRVTAALAVGVVLLTIWNLGYWVGDWTVFFVPVALPVGIWAGAGLRALTRCVDRALGDRRPWAAGVLTAGVIVLVPASMLQQNWSRNHRGEWRHYDKACAVLGQLAPNSIYVSELDDGFFLPMYLQVVEGRRPDVVVTGSSRSHESWDYDPEVTPIIDALMERWQGPASPTPEARSESSLRFAAVLAELVGSQRPVYCFALQPRPPGYLPAVALWSELFLMTTESPELLVACEASGPVAEYDGGISLARVTVEPEEVRPCELLKIDLDWRCDRRVDESPAVLISLAQRREGGDPVQPQGMLLRYGTWLAYGRQPLPATPAGSAYRQRLIGIAPTDARPGEWVVRVGLADSMEEAVPVIEVARFRILPTG